MKQINQNKLRTTPIEHDEVKLRALDALIRNSLESVE